MSFLNDTTIDVLNKSMSAANVRHETMTNNIANINTRGYKADRVYFEDELKKAMGLPSGKLQLATTNEKHIGVGKSLDEVVPVVYKDPTETMRLDGNNVDIDIEMANVAANQLLYEAFIERVNGKISTYRAVISGGTR